MIKKTPVEQLRPGMYISDMNAGWLGHPFLFNRLLLENEVQIAAIRIAGIRDVYVDTERGLDPPDAPSAAEAAASTEEDIRHSVERGGGRVTERSPMAEELSRARRVYADAASLVRTAMQDVRLGQPLDLDAAQHMARRLVGSVLRNSDALMVVCRLREQDEYTFRHSVSVSVMLANLARSLGSDLDAMVELALGGLIHDVGKMLVNPAVLHKPGRLTPDEFDHMRSHVARGAELARTISGLPALALAVLEGHHERFDGSGYPRGQKGKDISAAGRMAALCDVYDAITSDRCYHRRIDPAAGMRRLFDWSRHHFDPDITHAFVRSIGIYPVGSLVRLDSGFLAVVVEQRESSLLQPVVRVVFDARRQHYVAPRQVDLSRRNGAAPTERIMGHEDPERWDIDVSYFMA